MEIRIDATAIQSGAAAAACGAAAIRAAIAERGTANIIVATGASQFDVLAALVASTVDWSAVTGFHLDEYLGLSTTHPASFRGYLQDRLVGKVPLREFFFVNGEATNPTEECQRLGALIENHPIDVAFVGIGENGHLAFNDPPADFETRESYIVVQLDEACRQQQAGEGWFSSMDDVPQRAISMSIQQILKARSIVCTVPDQRKAGAVKSTVEGPVTPDVPASILQQHPRVTLFLDEASASQMGSSRGSEGEDRRG